MEESYNILIEYATSLYNRNLKTLANNLYQPMDFVHNIYDSNADVEVSKKLIRDYIITEKRRIIGRMQHQGKCRFDVYEKRCGKCLERKPIQLFSPRIDKRTGYKYYSTHCKECQAETSLERRRNHVVTEHERKLNRERQSRWAKLQKQIKNSLLC